MTEFDELKARLTNEIKNTIEKVFDEFRANPSYYRMQFRIHELDGNLLPYTNWYILYDNHNGYCTFCGKETFFYDSRFSNWLCAECYGKIHNK